VGKKGPENPINKKQPSSAGGGGEKRKKKRKKKKEGKRVFLFIGLYLTYSPILQIEKDSISLVVTDKGEKKKRKKKKGGGPICAIASGRLAFSAFAHRTQREAGLRVAARWRKEGGEKRGSVQAESFTPIQKAFRGTVTPMKKMKERGEKKRREKEATSSAARNWLICHLGKKQPPSAWSTGRTGKAETCDLCPNRVHIAEGGGARALKR